MADYAAWTQTFRDLRLRANCGTKEELAREFSKITLANGGQLNLSANEISRYETSKERVPKRRERHLELIECFAVLGALETREQVNQWLGQAGQGYLTPDETARIFKNSASDSHAEATIVQYQHEDHSPESEPKSSVRDSSVENQSARTMSGPVLPSIWRSDNFHLTSIIVMLATAAVATTFIVMVVLDYSEPSPSLTGSDVRATAEAVLADQSETQQVEAILAKDTPVLQSQLTPSNAAVNPISLSEKKSPQDESTTLHPLLTIRVAGSGSDQVRSVAFSPDGSIIASGGKDNAVHLWDTLSGEKLLSLEGHTDTISDIAWSPNGRTLASGSKDRTVQIWDATTGDQLLSPFTGHSNGVMGISWSSDGERIASGGLDRQIIVWSTADGSIQSSAYIGNDANSVTWSPDSKQLAVSSSGSLLLFATDDRLIETTRLTGEWGDSWDVAWSFDGQYLAAAGHDTNIHVWPVNNWNNKKSLQGHSNTVTSVAWSPDSTRLVSTSYDGSVRVWDVIAETELPTKLATPEGGGGILTVDWTRDGNRLAASGVGMLWVWDAALFGTGVTTPSASE